MLPMWKLIGTANKQAQISALSSDQGQTGHGKSAEAVSTYFCRSICFGGLFGPGGER